MLRRELLLTIVGFGLSAAVEARPRPEPDFRTADLVGGSFAMRTSQLALQRRSNPDVINFAHAEIAEQVEVAQQLGAEPGSAPVRADQALILAKLERAGPAFERMYVQGQIGGHRELLALNARFLRANGNDPRERNVAEMSLPIIHRHLAILNGLREIA